MMKKSESPKIQLTNHEKHMLRKLAKGHEDIKRVRSDWERKCRIKREDEEDAPFRRKIVK